MALLKSGFSAGGPLFALPLVKEEGDQTHFVPPHFEKNSDEAWMLEALIESLKGIGITNPNPSVGCILVNQEGHEISRGFTQAFGGYHAERVAFKNVRDPRQLEGATAYVTLEPCSHYGKQPPCVELFLSSPIQRIVIATMDAHPEVNGKGIKMLQEAGKRVDVGTLAHESQAWNFPFHAQLKLHRPMFALKWAQTMDGQLADDSNTSQWITGIQARSYTHWLRQKYDAILIGGASAVMDFPQLSARNCTNQIHAQPIPIIFDPKGKCLGINEIGKAKLKQNLFTDQRKIILFISESVLLSNPSHWLKNHPHILILPLTGSNLISEAVNRLREGEIEAFIGKPLQSVMVEGGAKTLSSFLKAGYADLLHVFIAPKITGGQSNRIQTKKLLADCFNYTVQSSFSLASDTVIELIKTP